MTTPIQCPVCLHDETMRARIHEREPMHDDVALMRWRPPHGGARGQVVTRWDEGSWVCERCDLPLSPHDAGVLLDAALRHSHPDCDSIRGGLHEDVRRAFAGGREEEA